jgi:hypothetical protein
VQESLAKTYVAWPRLRNAEAYTRRMRATTAISWRRRRSFHEKLSDGHLSQQQEAELYRYYGLDYTEALSDSGLPPGNDQAQTGGERSAGHDTSGPTTDEAMTRSEERLNVGTRTEETGRVRLRKYVVTENVTRTVPVRREEAEEHEVTLTEERPVVGKETVPVEGSGSRPDGTTAASGAPNPPARAPSP